MHLFLYVSIRTPYLNLFPRRVCPEEGLFVYWRQKAHELPHRQLIIVPRPSIQISSFLDTLLKKSLLAFTVSHEGFVSGRDKAVAPVGDVPF